MHKLTGSMKELFRSGEGKCGCSVGVLVEVHNSLCSLWEQHASVCRRPDQVWHHHIHNRVHSR